MIAYMREVKAHPPTFTRRLLKLVAVLLLLPFLNACGDKPKNYADFSYYVDKAAFAQGRPCPAVLFNCLPESQDKGWQDQKKNKDNAIDFFELTPDVKMQFKTTRGKWNRIYEEKSMDPYVIDEEDEAWMDEFERKHFLDEMEQQLAKEFPEFWRDVPHPVRYRWLRRAISKANKYDYNGEQTDAIQIIELCARIGLDFDLDPKWEAITQFVRMPDGPLLGYGGEAVKYIDFTVFENNISAGGTRFTDWSLREALQFLPYPKRKVPSLND